jgi:hypothetical protein
MHPFSSGLWLVLQFFLANLGCQCQGVCGSWRGFPAVQPHSGVLRINPLSLSRRWRQLQGIGIIHFGYWNSSVASRTNKQRFFQRTEVSLAHPIILFFFRNASIDNDLEVHTPQAFLSHPTLLTFPRCL